LKQIKAERILFLDHGGYLAYHLEDFKRALPIAGIVEYGLNGEKRFSQCNLGGVNYASIGLSPIKRFADYSCGKLIGELSMPISQSFRGYGNHLRSITQVGVIGFGKLGSNAAEMMRMNGAHNIMVFDTNPEKMIEAGQKGYNIQCGSVEELVSQCNMIIVGADTAPIKPFMYDSIRNHTIIGTVTSPDDTLDIDTLLAEEILINPKIEKKEPRITTYSHGNKKIHLICGGDAPNLKGSNFGIDDPTLFMPLSLHGLVGHELLTAGSIDKEKISHLERFTMEQYLLAYRQTIQSFERGR
jgi:S-adenosylhomocysteine hydrolase